MPNLAVDATSTSTTPSWSHTCTGSNLALIIGHMNTGNTVNPSTTYNGVAATFIDSISNGSTVLNLYYLLAPSTGSNTISVSVGGGNFDSGYATSYTGARQSSQPEKEIAGSALSGTSYSTSLTPAFTNCWLIAAIFATNGMGAGGGAGAGTTARAVIANNSKKGIYDSNGAVTVNQSDSLNWTADSSTGWRSVIITLAATDSVKPSGNAIFFGTNF